MEVARQRRAIPMIRFIVRARYLFVLAFFWGSGCKKLIDLATSYVKAATSLSMLWLSCNIISSALTWVLIEVTDGAGLLVSPPTQERPLEEWEQQDP